MPVCHYFLKGTCRYGDECRFDHPAPRGRDVCQYFLRGSCKFGDRCKFEHPSGGSSGFCRDSTSSTFGHRGQSSFGGQNFNSTSFSSSRRWQSGSKFGQNRFDVLSGGANFDGTFGHQQNQQKPSSARETKHTPSAIQQKVKADLEAWEASHQWPLSCYSFSKGPCISGLMDHSPEELRFTAYNCNTQGNMAAYQEGLAALLGAHKQRRNQLKAMSAVQIADEIKKEGEGGTEDSGFAAVFGGSHPQTGSSQGAFKMFSSMESTPAGFGGSGFSQSAFNAQQPSGVFGSSNSKPGGSVFGETRPQEPSSFGSSSAQPMSSFGDQAKSSDSSSMMTEYSGFGTCSQSGTTIGSSGASVASGSENSGPVTELTKTMAGAAFASAFQLTEEDLAAFKAPAFTLGKIPECPPPLELC